MSEKTVLLATRLAEILQKLNTGVTLSVKELALEFNVSERTIQKDLNDRIDPTIIEPLGYGKYKLVPGFLGNITPKDIKEFSELSGIIDLYPNIDDVLRRQIRDSLLVKSTINRACIPGANEFKEINFTIINFLKLKFSYNDKDVISEPYKLLNHNGIWYLLTLVENKIKSYCVHKMKKVRRDINNFKINSKLLNEIIDNPSPWFKEKKIPVTLKIKGSFSDYFIDRNILPERDSFTKENNGELIVHMTINSLEEIKGQIKFWLPNIDVIKPIELKESIKKDIKSFL